MKVHIHWQWGTTGMAVYVHEGGQGGLGPFRILRVHEGGDTFSWEDADPLRTDLKPTITLPKDVLEAIVEEASNVLPPSEAQGAHLKDAIAVRDRLLTLVEGKP